MRGDGGLSWASQASEPPESDRKRSGIMLELGQLVPVQGLSQAEVRERVLAGQVNTAPPTPGRTTGQILRANVLTRFNAILGALFVLVMIVGPPQDALFGV